jgi:NAD(P)-dependent dehydrogenase (short-subunit alcohol dehydrogenase family)
MPPSRGSLSTKASGRRGRTQRSEIKEVSYDFLARSFRAVLCDTSNDNQVNQVVTTAVRVFGGVDVLGNGSGTGANLKHRRWQTACSAIYNLTLSARAT